MTTRTLLLTDLVDSTALAERLGTDAAAALGARHDRVARDLLAQHGGREIDKTDGFLFLFEEPSVAADYARAYHRALEPLELKARAGLHTGEVALRENPPADVLRGAKPLEVEGVAKSLAARVMGLAQGGQTLATRGSAPEGARSHGHWRLKGLSELVELFEVTGDGTPPPDAPKAWRVVWQGEAWVPLREVKHHLPRERDAFVGRAADLQELARQLDEGAPLVSVLGMGGTGKTRLVLHYAWTWLGQWPGGAWFCDLSEARTADGIVSAVATAFDVPLGKDDPVTQLGHAIAGRGRCLVILDNFEQVTRWAPETLGRWLDRARDAQFVVTTREMLGLPGEQAIALAPLTEADAVELFVSRARSARRDFELTAGDRPHVRALAKLLDGLPLAIELAAARVRVMPPKTLLERMSQRFKLLSSSVGRHTRQATLRATFDWSWELLSADEQQALAQLSVFEGGFTLEAAEGVLGLDALWPTDAVQGLVDKSWVRPTSSERFDLLGSVQEYGAEKLDALGGRSASESRHGAWCAALGTEEALGALVTHGGTERRQALSSELDNLLAACRRAVTRGDGAVALATLQASWATLELRGPFAVGADLGAAVLGMALSAEDAVRGGRACGRALQLLGRMEQAGAHFERALALAREVGDRRSEAFVLDDLGSLHAEQGRTDEARARYEQALAVHLEVGDRRAEGVVLGHLGTLHQLHGRMDEARARYEQALALHREVGDRRFEGVALGSVGILHAEQGRMEEARASYEQALALHREVGDRRAEGLVLGQLGALHHDQGRMDEARRFLEQSLTLHREVGDRRSEGNVLGNLGALDREQGRMDEAQALFEQALAVHREVGNRRFEGMVLFNLGGLHLVQGRMEEARQVYEQALAVHRKVGDRTNEGYVLRNLGILHQVQGRMEEARALFEQVLALHREVGDRRAEGVALGALGNLHLEQGRMDEARPLYERALASAREVGDRRSEGHVLGNLGILHQQQGRMDEARACFEQALAVDREVGDRRFEGIVLCNLGTLHQAQGRMDEARAHYEQALVIHREVGDRRVEGCVLGNLGSLHLEQGRRDEARPAFAEGERLLREVGDRFELAKLLCGRARLEVALGHLDDARQVLAEPEALAVELGTGPEGELGQELARAHAALESP